MTKLIAEIGINHNGNINEAKKLIEIASLTNCWAVKFQFRDLKSYFSHSVKSSELGKEIIDAEIRKNYLTSKNILILSKYARKKNLKVGLSLFFKTDYKFFKKFKFDFFKVPSPVSHDFDLINFLKKKSSLLIISFGGKTFSDIKKIIRRCNLKSKKTVLLHCISNYPVNEINSNLGFIDKLKKYFKNYYIGYSSHEKNILNSILCLAKDINFLERHITLNKEQNGLDHSSSSDYDELKLFQNYNENFFKIFKDNNKFPPNQGEVLNIQNLGTSYFFKKNVDQGERLKFDQLKKIFPCIGLTDLNIDKFINKKLKRNVKINEPVTKSLFFNNAITQSQLIELNKLKISLPIRPRDYQDISSQIPINNFEMHLSFKDIENFKTKNFDYKFIKNKKFTLHMPDYCDENTIIDFFSDNKNTRQKSLSLLKKTLSIVTNINKINKSKKFYIIVSLSKLNNSSDKFTYYRKIKSLTDNLKKRSIYLLPQWLPVDAWYFGGNVKTNAFSDPRDLDYIKKIGLKICLDTSHFLLSCNYHNLNALKFFMKNKEIYKHYHLSDADGTDAEGILIGKGQIIKSGIMKEILNDKKTIKVLETWQGHLNSLFNFKQDIKKILNTEK